MEAIVKRRKTDGPVKVAVLGAGPVGLEAALALRSLDGVDTHVIVFERGPKAGAEIRARWPHVPLFSPWKLNQSAAARKVVPGLDPEQCPTGLQFCEQHLDPLRAHLQDELGVEFRFNETVVSVVRAGVLKGALGSAKRSANPLAVFTAATADPDTEVMHVGFDVVLDCSGSTSERAHAGMSGAPAVGERALARDPTKLFRYIPAVGQFRPGKTVAVIGSGYSAATSIRNLQASGCKVAWVTRRPKPTYEVLENDPLTLRTGLCEGANGYSGEAFGNAQVVAMKDAGDGRIELELSTVDDADGIHMQRGELGPVGRGRAVQVDAVVSNVGLRPDASIHSELQVHLCYASDGPMKLAASLLGASGDCLAQEAPGPETMRNPEPNFYVLGVKSYGRGSAFLLRVGSEQVTAVAGLIRDEFLK